LITSRKPEDLEAFSTALLRQIEHGAAEPMRSPRIGGRGGEAAEAHKDRG
jgi:hypothetical protein